MVADFGTETGEEAGQALTEAASKYGEVNLYVGGDGLIHAT